MIVSERASGHGSPNRGWSARQLGPSCVRATLPRTSTWRRIAASICRDQSYLSANVIANGYLVESEQARRVMGGEVVPATTTGPPTTRRRRPRRRRSSRARLALVTTTALTLQPTVTSVTSVTPEPSTGAVARRRRPGRPTLLDDGAGDVLLAAVRAGNRLSVAARAAGLAPSTVEEWMRRGRGLDVRPATPVFVRFVEAVEVAQAAAEAEAIAAVRGAMAKDWKAAAWYLANVSPYWRQSRMPPPEPPVPLAPQPVPPPWQGEIDPAHAGGAAGSLGARATGASRPLGRAGRAAAARAVTAGRERPVVESEVPFAGIAARTPMPRCQLGLRMPRVR